MGNLKIGHTKNTTAKMGLTKVAAQCSADTFIVNQSLIFRINPESIPDAEKHAGRQSAVR